MWTIQMGGYFKNARNYKPGVNYNGSLHLIQSKRTTDRLKLLSDLTPNAIWTAERRSDGYCRPYTDNKKLIATRFYNGVFKTSAYRIDSSQ